MLKKGVERTLSKVGIQSYKYKKKKKTTLLHAGDVHGLKIPTIPSFYFFQKKQQQHSILIQSHVNRIILPAHKHLNQILWQHPRYTK